MTSLDISNNKLVEETDYIKKERHGLTEGDMVEYNGVQCPVVFSVTNEYKVLDISGAIALADGIENSGALVTVTINKFALPIQDIKTKAELNLSGKDLCAEDAIIIAALIPLNVSRTKRFNCCCLLILLL